MAAITEELWATQFDSTNSLDLLSFNVNYSQSQINLKINLNSFQQRAVRWWARPPGSTNNRSLTDRFGSLKSFESKHLSELDRPLTT